MKYAILNVVPDNYASSPLRPSLFDLHEIESAVPDLVGPETWIQFKKSGNSFMVKETPTEIWEMLK